VTYATPLSQVWYFGIVGRVNVKLYTKFEVCSILMGRAKLKLCNNLELSGFTSFGDILEGMPKILGVT